MICSPVVTEKAYESESYSETEDDVRPSKPATKAPAPAKPSASKREEDKKSHKKAAACANKGTKQASIMGFFQKKWWKTVWSICVGSGVITHTCGTWSFWGEWLSAASHHITSSGGTCSLIGYSNRMLQVSGYTCGSTCTLVKSR